MIFVTAEQKLPKLLGKFCSFCQMVVLQLPVVSERSFEFARVEMGMNVPSKQPARTVFEV